MAHPLRLNTMSGKSGGINCDRSKRIFPRCRKRTAEEKSQRTPGRLRPDGQGRDEDQIHRYIDLDGRRQDQLPDIPHQPQDGDRHLSGRPAPGRALVKEAIKEAGLSGPKTFWW